MHKLQHTPNTWAIDGTHIDIPAPTTDSKTDYYRRKQKYKIKTQAVVCVNLVFLDVGMAIAFPEIYSRRKKVVVNRILSKM